MRQGGAGSVRRGSRRPLATASGSDRRVDDRSGMCNRILKVVRPLVGSPFRLELHRLGYTLIRGVVVVSGIDVTHCNV